jgi:hypothetical protein
VRPRPSSVSRSAVISLPKILLANAKTRLMARKDSQDIEREH